MSIFSRIRIIPRTLVCRHILILGILFFTIQIVCLELIFQYLIRVQVDVNLNNKAYLFSSTYAFISSINEKYRDVYINRFTNARLRFYISKKRPNVDYYLNETDELFKERILYTLAAQYKGIDFAYENIPWPDYTPPEANMFCWKSGNFEEYKKNIPLIVKTDLPRTSLRILWGKRSPSKDEQLKITAIAALPFSDGTWLVANIHDNEYIAADTTILFFSLMAQFIVLMVVVVLEIKFLVRPLKKLQSDAGHINLDSPMGFHVPQNSYDEVKTLAVAIRDLTLRLSEQIHQRSMTLTCLSHDLRSPVCRMRMQMERMEKDGIKEVQILNNSIEELQDLIDSVLSFARSGKINENAVMISLPSLLFSLAEDFEDGGNSVRIIRADVCNIYLYPQAMRRCLQNIVQNAIDYAKKSDECFDHDGCEVQIEGINDKDYYIITIRDFGTGIPEKNLDQVFEPFVRLENSRNRKTGGTGLGLSIARNLARINNADITLKNMNPGLLVTIRISKLCADFIENKI